MRYSGVLVPEQKEPEGESKAMTVKGKDGGRMRCRELMICFRLRTEMG